MAALKHFAGIGQAVDDERGQRFDGVDHHEVVRFCERRDVDLAGAQFRENALRVRFGGEHERRLAERKPFAQKLATMRHSDRSLS